MPFVESSIELLKKEGYKITNPRMVILNVLAEAKMPLSAYDIEEHIPEEVQINIVTIYRVLEVFEALGLVHKVHTKEGYVRCDFEKQEGCHSFAICSKCGRSKEFVQKQCHLEGQLPKKMIYKSLSHISEIAGVCRRCA